MERKYFEKNTNFDFNKKKKIDFSFKAFEAKMESDLKNLRKTKEKTIETLRQLRDYYRYFGQGSLMLTDNRGNNYPVEEFTAKYYDFVVNQLPMHDTFLASISDYWQAWNSDERKIRWVESKRYQEQINDFFKNHLGPDIADLYQRGQLECNKIIQEITTSTQDNNKFNSIINNLKEQMQKIKQNFETHEHWLFTLSSDDEHITDESFKNLESLKCAIDALREIKNASSNIPTNQSMEVTENDDHLNTSYSRSTDESIPTNQSTDFSSSSTSKQSTGGPIPMELYENPTETQEHTEHSRKIEKEIMNKEIKDAWKLFLNTLKQEKEQSRRPITEIVYCANRNFSEKKKVRNSSNNERILAEYMHKCLLWSKAKTNQVFNIAQFKKEQPKFNDKFPGTSDPPVTPAEALQEFLAVLETLPSNQLSLMRDHKRIYQLNQFKVQGYIKKDNLPGG